MDWMSLLWLAGAAFMGWLLYRRIRQNPEAFSLVNFSKSARTLGLLALTLIAFIGLLVLMLRS